MRCYLPRLLLFSESKFCALKARPSDLAYAYFGVPIVINLDGNIIFVITNVLLLLNLTKV